MKERGNNTMKKKLIAYYGDSPVHVEGFPSDCARSCKGSVHVLPRTPTTVTEDEYEHIKSEYKWMLPKLRVVAELGVEKEMEGAKAEAEAPSDPPKPKTRKKKSSSKAGKKAKKKKRKR